MDNIQKRIGRNNPPRVHITYDVELNGAKIVKELPYVIGIIASLGGSKINNIELKDRTFTTINPNNINHFLQYINPTINMGLKLFNKDEVFPISLNFNAINDFHPDQILNNVTFLNPLKNHLQLLIDLVQKLEMNTYTYKYLTKLLEEDKTKIDNISKNDLIDIVYKSELIIFKDMEQYGLDLLNVLFFYKNKITDLMPSLNRIIVELEEELSTYLDQILHNPIFQQLETSWGSILSICKKEDPLLKIKVLNITKNELKDDLNNNNSVEESNIFKKLYEEEYGTSGGEPYSTLIVDTYIERHMEDFQLISQLSEVVSAAHIPTITSIDPSILNLKSFRDIYNPKSIKNLFNSLDMAYWKSYRMKDEAKYITFTLPRVLYRNPYGTSHKINTFLYIETINPSESQDFSWGNSAYKLGEKIGESFIKYRWCASIRGSEDGKVDNLPMYIYKSATGEDLSICPTEIGITDRREKELNDMGFISLCYFKNSNYSIFYGGQTSAMELTYDSNEATENYQLSTTLPHILTASRFVHYMKCMLRDYIGTFTSGKQIETVLQKWLASYVLLDSNSSSTIKSKYPLREASVIVKSKPGKNGEYYGIIRLKPHFQLEGMEISTRLVAKLPIQKK